MAKKDNFVSLDFNALLSEKSLAPKSPKKKAESSFTKKSRSVEHTNNKKPNSRKTNPIPQVDAQFITSISTEAVPGKFSIKITYDDMEKLTDTPKKISPMVKSINLSLLQSLQEMLRHFS